MNRYIIEKKGLELLALETLDACEQLGKEKIITNEQLHFKQLPFASVLLTEQQVDILEQAGFKPQLEKRDSDVSLTIGKTYEKVRSSYYKAQKQTLTGKGVKVGVLDSGCNTAVVPCEFTQNFADGNPFTDVFGHGTKVTSIIKHPTMGLAPDCEMHHVKAIGDVGTMTESAALAALDYALDNSLDVLNLSWTFNTPSTNTAIASAIAAGIVVVAASGNSSTEVQTLIPAALPGVVAVNTISEEGGANNFNILPNTSVVDGHGITVACGGWETEVYTSAGVYTLDWGTSFAAPFFTGVFAVYKEQLQETDNYRILNHVLSRCMKTSYPKYFGVGTPTF